MADLSDRVVLITGASSGIGEATARRLAKAGAKVALAARRKDKLDAIATDIKQNDSEAVALQADITDKAVAPQLVKQVQDEWGKLDVLVNNAGVMLTGPVMDAPLEEWERMVQLNVMGLLYMTKAALPIMQEQGDGHIVNISSVAGRVIRPGSAVYNLTKWGVGAFTDALRQELVAVKTGIRTTLIEPGAVTTELQSHLRPEILEQWKQTYKGVDILQPEDIAESIYYALSQPRRVSINEILVRPSQQAA